jgi:GGDEF domain-containing protein
MYPGPPRLRRARPVTDLALDALLERRHDLTKGWLLALIEDAPLEQAGTILAAGLVREGPRLCEGILRALTDDDELGALDRGGQIGRLVFQAGELAGASDAEAAVRAIDALGAVVWSAVLPELSDPDAEQVARLAERLAVVMKEVRAAAVRRYSAAEEPVAPLSPVGPEPVAPAAPEAPSPPLEPVRDELWVRALEEEIEKSRHAGMALSLLLVELDDADRIRTVESGSEVGASFGRFAQAMRTALRRRDILACETDTRAWVVARDTMRAGAQSLGGRIAGAVQAAEPWRGAPLTVSVGVAVLGEDGQDREALMGAAEQDRFAAAASGTAVNGGVGPDAENDRPPDGWAS